MRVTAGRMYLGRVAILWLVVLRYSAGAFMHDDDSQKAQVADARKLLSRLLGGGGLIFILAVIYFYISGEILVGGSGQVSMELEKTVTHADDPTEFWALIGLTAFLGCGLIFTAIKVRPSK